MTGPTRHRHERAHDKIWPLAQFSVSCAGLCTVIACCAEQGPVCEATPVDWPYALLVHVSITPVQTLRMRHRCESAPKGTVFARSCCVSPYNVLLYAQRGTFKRVLLYIKRFLFAHLFVYIQINLTQYCYSFMCFCMRIRPVKAENNTNRISE